MTVYFIGAGHGMNGQAVKIGFTKGCPHQRLASLQTGSPVLLDLLHHETGYGVEYERALHEYFADKWMHGEWFDLDDDVWCFIRMLQGGELLHEMIDPKQYPNGLRCEAAMNVAGVYAGVKGASYSYQEPDWLLYPATRT